MRYTEDTQEDVLPLSAYFCALLRVGGGIGFRTAPRRTVWQKFRKSGQRQGERNRTNGGRPDEIHPSIGDRMLIGDAAVGGILVGSRVFTTVRPNGAATLAQCV